MPSGKPEDGYGFQAKKSYRRKVWDFVDFALRRSVPVGKRIVAILDTAEGHETRELIKRGYKPANIHVSNRNPAELAWLTRRLDADGISGINTHGSDFLRSLCEVELAGSKFNAVNFDACSAIGWGLGSEDPIQTWGGYLHEVALRVAYGGVVAHTFLVGRERGEMAESLSDCTGYCELHGKLVRKSVVSRLAFATFYVQSAYKEKCDLHISDIVYDSYMSSSGQRMAWFAAKVIPHSPVSPAAFINKCRRYYSDADRATVLTLPMCINDAHGGADFGSDENILYWTGKSRFKTGRCRDDSSDDDGDGAFMPFGDGRTTCEVMRT